MGTGYNIETQNIDTVQCFSTQHSLISLDSCHRHREAKAPETHCVHLTTPCNHREIGLTCQFGASAQVQVATLPQPEFALGPQSPAHSVYQSCREKTNQRTEKGYKYKICSTVWANSLEAWRFRVHLNSSRIIWSGSHSLTWEVHQELLCLLSFGVLRAST